MNRFMNDKIGRKKKKSHLENHPLETQLSIILDQFDDPIEAVRDVLDPEHKYIVKSDLRVAPPRPKEPFIGVFRLIYSTASIDGAKTKIKSKEFEAKDGFDAKLQFEISKIKDKSHSQVLDVECLYVPRSIRDRFLKEYHIYDQGAVLDPIMKMAWLTLIEDLEKFEEEKSPADLSKLINDE